MPKLGIFSGRKICDILRMQGFVLVRQRGSHAIMQKQTASGTITVPVPLHSTVRIGTLQSIIRQSGLARELLMR